MLVPIAIFTICRSLRTMIMNGILKMLLRKSPPAVAASILLLPAIYGWRYCLTLLSRRFEQLILSSFMPSSAPSTSRYPFSYTAIATRIATFSYSPPDYDVSRCHPHRPKGNVRPARGGCASPQCEGRLSCSAC